MIRDIIVQHLKAVAAEQEIAIVQPLTDDLVLLQSGLDSLAYAVLVARLEEALGYDPFVLMAEPVYPRTFGEFVAVYERYAPEKA